jgi:lipopolysaccharide transport system ATP-binding protein
VTDTVISIEGISKSYLVGHQSTQRATHLRDVLVQEGRNLLRKVADAFSGRQIVEGNEVETFWALKDVSFTVNRGDVVGIIGKNGAGKSTLLKIISRITEPTEGRIRLRGRIGSLLEVGTGFHPELTGRENIFLNGAILGMSHREISRKLDEIVAFAELDTFVDTPVKRYSSGMYVRLAFSVAAHLEPEILIVDEVLAVGDAEFQKRCLGKMNNIAREGRTILTVSHNMDVIKRLCNRAVWLERGSVKLVSEPAPIVSEYLGSTISPNAVWRAPALARPHSVLFVEAVLYDKAGNPKSSFLFGEEFRVALKLHNSRGSPIRAVVGVEFSTEDGTSLFTTHSNDRGQNGVVPVGDSVVELFLEPNVLMPGRYSLRFGLVDYTWSLLDLTETSVVIEIYNVAVSDEQLSMRRPGKLALSFRWSEIRVDAQDATAAPC